MATFRIEVSTHKKKDGTYPIYIRATHKKKLRRMKTDLFANATDLTRDGKLKNGNLKWKCDELIQKLYKAQNEISLFDLPLADVDFVVKSVKETLNKEDWHLDFFTFADEYIQKANIKESTKHTYRVAVSALARFVGVRFLDINNITRPFLQDFSDFLANEPRYYFRKKDGKTEATKKKKQAGTGARAYITKLGTIFRAAQDRYNDEEVGNIRIPRSPFKRIKTHEKRQMGGQRGLPLETFRAIIAAETVLEAEREALDIFVLSFCTMGANMVDLYMAQPPQNGIWTYDRQKTSGRSKDDHTRMTIRIPECAQPFIDRLTRGSEKGKWLNLSRRYSKPDYATKSINVYLKRWATKNGFPSFTFYAARKSWAGYARELGIEKATIDECLAHVGDHRMADLYIGDRRSKLQWDANEKVCSYAFYSSSSSGSQ